MVHSGKSIVSIPLVLARQMDTLIATIRERHFTLNRNLSGLVVVEILKTDLQVADYIHLAVFKLG